MTTALTGTTAYSDLVASDSELVGYIYATWTPRQYHIYYESGTTGTVSNMPASPVTTTWDAAIATPANPSQPGATFSRWGLVQNHGQAGETIVFMPNSGSFRDYVVTIYGPSANENTTDTVYVRALWSYGADYNVFFDDGVTDTTQPVDATTMPVNREHIIWTTDDINASAPVREGWVFNGWIIKNTTGGASIQIGSTAAGTNKVYSDLARVNGVEDDSIMAVTLVAQWTPVQYRITYADGDAGTGTMVLANTVREDATWYGTSNESPTDPTKTGYTFVGWAYRTISGSTTVDHKIGSSTLYKDIAAQTGVTKNQYVGGPLDDGSVGIVLYAMWKKNVDYKIRVMLDLVTISSTRATTA